MAWDEWEQLKTAASERHTTRMQLNQLPADPGGSTPGGSGGGIDKLRSDKAAWTTAGEGVGDLRDKIGRGLSRVRAAADWIENAVTRGQVDLDEQLQKPLKGVSRSPSS
jgi:hypothetical protein